MKIKLMVLSSFLVFLPNFASADNVGGCGVGSKLFAGQKGLAPQVLAILTNGTFINTFAVTSGTSGCTQDGLVTSNWKTAAFIDGNMNKLALDISRGQGESLSSLASLVGVSAADSAHFNSTMQKNFAQIFSDSDVDSNAVAAAVKNVLAADQTLARYSANV